MKPALALVFILVIVFLSFHPALDNDFAGFDDKVYITKCDSIRKLSLENIKNIFTSYHKELYKPLVLLSFAIEYRFFGLDPSIYHLTNLALHMVNCLLVFWLIMLLTRRLGVAFIVTLLFGIHPTRVESVAWISERKDLLYSLFFLLSVIGYCYYLRIRSKRWYLFSAAALTLSLMAKPMALTLPFLLLVFDYFAGRRLDKKTLIEKLPFLFIALVFLFINFRGLGVEFSIADQRDFLNFPDNFFRVSLATVFYIKKLFLPVNLSIHYPYPEKVAGIFAPSVVLLLAALVVFSGRYSKKNVFGALFFAITILPVIQIFRISPTLVCDHYTYIPYIGLFYIAAEGARRLYRRPRRLYKGVIILSLILVSAAFSVMSNNYSRVWKDSVTLTTNIINLYPEYELAYISRGWIYLRNKDYAPAFRDFDRAVELGQNNMSYRNRAAARYVRNEFTKAKADIDRAIGLDPKDPRAYFIKGKVLERGGDTAGAIAAYEKAIEVDPKCAYVYNTLGLIYYENKEMDKAFDYFDSSIALVADNPIALHRRGVLYMDEGLYDLAVRDFETILKHHPRHPAARSLKEKLNKK